MTSSLHHHQRTNHETPLIMFCRRLWIWTRCNRGWLDRVQNRSLRIRQWCFSIWLLHLVRCTFCYGKPRFDRVMNDRICCCRHMRFPPSKTAASDRTMNWQGTKGFSRAWLSPAEIDIWISCLVVALLRMRGSVWVDGDCTVLWTGHLICWCCRQNLDLGNSLRPLGRGF